MSDYPSLNPKLADVALRYPEKTFYLGQVFNDTTNSYKLFWFLAILSLLKRSPNRSISFTNIFTEVVAAAWHPVCLFHLSLGRQDKLQDTILEIKQQSGLAPSADSETIRRFAEGSLGTQKKLEYLQSLRPNALPYTLVCDAAEGRSR